MNNAVGAIGLTVLAIVLSCTMNSLLIAFHVAPQMAPAVVGVAVGETKETAAGDTAIREDMAIPEFNFVDSKSREPNGFATNIRDSKQASRSEFPQNGL